MKVCSRRVQPELRAGGRAKPVNRMDRRSSFCDDSVDCDHDNDDVV